MSSKKSTTPSPKPAPALRASQSAAANPAFQSLTDARAAVPGLSTFKPPTKSRRGANLVTDKYLEIIARAVDGSPDLRAATKIDTTQLRQQIAFVNAFAPFPAMCARLQQDVTAFLDQTLQEMSAQARAAAEWLAWKAKNSNDKTSATLVKQLRALPKGRGVSVPKTKKRTKSSVAKAVKDAEKTAKAEAKAAKVTKTTTVVTEPAPAKANGAATA